LGVESVAVIADADADADGKRLTGNAPCVRWQTDTLQCLDG